MIIDVILVCINIYQTIALLMVTWWSDFCLQTAHEALRSHQKSLKAEATMRH